VNYTHFPEEDHLPDWARQDNKVTKGDRVEDDTSYVFIISYNGHKAKFLGTKKGLVVNFTSQPPLSKEKQPPVPLANKLFRQRLVKKIITKIWGPSRNKIYANKSTTSQHLVASSLILYFLI